MRQVENRCFGCMRKLEYPGRPCPFCGFFLKQYRRNSNWLAPGYVLNDKYMLGKVLGEGGFGITYIGWDQNLRTRVAIKEYFPSRLAVREKGENSGQVLTLLSPDQEKHFRRGLEQFMAEARSLSQFYQMDGIVKVRDFFFANETAYMVMEYVDGTTLKEYLRQKGGALDEKTVLQMMRPVMEALAKVHRTGLIHRDISPDNLMIDRGGQLRLIDFGAARMSGIRTEEEATVVLKHGYAPIEQYQAHGDQGPWTDVYALCATMYHMLSGRIPPSAMDRLHREQLQGFSGVSGRVSERTVRAVLEKGMALKKEQRFQSMEELLDALYGENDGDGNERKRFPKKIILAVCAAAVMGAAAWVILPGGLRPQREAETREPQAAVRSTETESGAEMQTTAETESGAETQAAAETESSAEMQVAAEIEGGTETQVAAETESGAETQVAAETESSAETQAAAEIEGGTETQAAAETESGAEAQTAAQTEKDTEGGYDWMQLPPVSQEELSALQEKAWEEKRTFSADDYHLAYLDPDGNLRGNGMNYCGELDFTSGGWDDIVSLSLGKYHAVGVRSDGTVVAAGDNSNGRTAVETWRQVVYAQAGESHTLGLLEDGTVRAAGSNEDGQLQTGGWTRILDVKAGSSHSLGLLEDGTVVAAGSNEKGQCEVDGWTDIAGIDAAGDVSAGLTRSGGVLLCGDVSDQMREALAWRQVVDISLGDGYIAGLLSNGEVVTAGRDGAVRTEGWNGIAAISAGSDTLFGRKENGAIVLSASSGNAAFAEGWTDLVKVAPGDGYLLGLKTDGSVVLGTATLCPEELTAVQSWSDVTDIAAGFGMAAGVKRDGTVLLTAQGYDEVSQWTGIRAVALADGMVLGLTQDGTVLTAGKSAAQSGFSGLEGVREFAASGDGRPAVLLEDGSVYMDGVKWSIREKDLTSLAVCGECQAAVRGDGTVVTANSAPQGANSWKDITQAAVGAQHVIGLKADGTVAATGSDENGQCAVDGWRDVAYIFAGPYQSYGIKKDGTLLIAGKLPGQY